MLAPESGKELRARLAKQLDDVLDTTADYNDQVADKADDFKKLAQEKAIQLTKQSEEIANLLKEKTGLASNELYADLKDQVVDLTNKVKNSVQKLDLTDELTDLSFVEDVEPKGEDIILDFEALAADEKAEEEESQDIVLDDVDEIIEQVASEKSAEKTEELEINNPSDDEDKQQEEIEKE